MTKKNRARKQRAKLLKHLASTGKGDAEYVKVVSVPPVTPSYCAVM